MPRNRRTPVTSQPTETTARALAPATDPTLITREVWRVALVFGILLVLLGGVAYWQQQSPTLNQLGASIQAFLQL